MIKQSEYLKLTMDDPQEAYSVDRVNENTRKIDAAIKSLSIRVEGLNMSDESITVTSEGETLDKVIDEIKKELAKKITLAEAPVPKSYDDEIKALKDAIITYKASVDEYSTQLGVYVKRHTEANNKLEALL